MLVLRRERERGEDESEGKPHAHGAIVDGATMSAVQRLGALLLALAILGGSAPLYSAGAKHACCRTKACPMMAGRSAAMQCTIASCDHAQPMPLPSVLAVIPTPAPSFDLAVTTATPLPTCRATEGIASAIDRPPRLWSAAA